MTARDRTSPIAEAKRPRSKTARDTPAAPEPATKITPVDRKVGEGPGNLRDRADAFNRRRGGKN